MIRCIYNPFTPYVMNLTLSDPPEEEVVRRALINRSTGTYWAIVEGDEPQAIIMPDEKQSEFDMKWTRYSQVQIALLFDLELDYGSLN